MAYASEVKDSKEEIAGDGLYQSRSTGNIFEVKGLGVRDSRAGSILTRRRRFRSFHASFRKFIKSHTDHVLPNEFLS